MENLIEYTVSVCMHLIKDGCKVELWVNYLTDQKKVLKLDNDIDRSQLKKIISALSMLNPNGAFLSTDQFYKLGFSKTDSKSLPLIIGTPPQMQKHQQWLQIKR
ncbi:hypothetical protein FZC78_06425 [Rossellomorea vietnamensis]|uniref:Uncharacterized protein n=1 Tax=Rossellomorea vietnamensis TaxID=218284 RepID=A0A5D4NUG3_9BACI|nr:hypothetical protein [Rossellomorea vietnamensis]TYS17509.1 hypothetical protein FZC78_06425 [Rossellomorea vietnamensis]